MFNILYLAWQYLLYNRVKTIVLSVSIALIAFLPLSLKVLVSQSSQSLMARAAGTPLLIGEKGSPLELTLNALYFAAKAPAEFAYREAGRVRDTELAKVIPLYTRYRAHEFAIVGTSLEYFDFRGLELAEGRNMALLGECVLGAEVAATLNLSVGDTIVSKPESAFDLAGSYPLKMHIVGVLRDTGTADDRAVFADLKTTWVIAGLAHGHQDVRQAQVLKRETDNVVANASLRQYNEVTQDNLSSFHFHGDLANYPLSAVIALPNDAKASALLQGKYLADNELMQIIRPSAIIDELLRTVVAVQNYVMVGAALTACATLMTAILVFVLSLRLRQAEITTMHRIGVARYRVILLLSTEIVVVVLIGLALALLLTLLLLKMGPELTNNLLF